MLEKVMNIAEIHSPPEPWNSAIDKGADLLGIAGLVCMGVQIGMFAMMGVVAVSFEGSAMQTYLGTALKTSPTWFKAIVLTSYMVAPFGALKLMAPALRAISGRLTTR